VDEVEEVAVAEVDEEEKNRRIETAHIAEGIIMPPRTAGSVRGSNPHGSSNHSHANVVEMPTMKMRSFAINAENLVICAMNAN